MVSVFRDALSFTLLVGAVSGATCMDPLAQILLFGPGIRCLAFCCCSGSAEVDDMGWVLGSAAPLLAAEVPCAYSVLVVSSRRTVLRRLGPRQCCAFAVRRIPLPFRVLGSGLVLLVAMLLAAFIPRGKFGAALAASLRFLVSVLDACCDALRVWPKFLQCLDQIISDLRWISQVARQLHPSSSMGSATAPAGEQQLVSVLVRRTRSSH